MIMESFHVVVIRCFTLFRGVGMVYKPIKYGSDMPFL